MAYSAKEDLLTGDIPLAGKYGDGTPFVNLAADEIDAQIGHLYVTPIVLEDVPANRPARLLLKKINNLLASGRIILDMAAGGEDDRLHAYGASMMKEAIDLLNAITKGQIVLTGAPLLQEAANDLNTAVSIKNEDPYSLVQGFYERYSQPMLPIVLNPMRPYDDRVV